jgi:Glycosyl transferase family 2
VGSPIRLVMTLLARDEADIVDAQIAFHLAAGVDFVVATDHASRDGTTDVLERYANRGVLHLNRESGGRLRQSEWVTRMARMAARDFGADWVINSDADEFWWPSGGDLKLVLAQTLDRYGVVQTFVRPFLPRPGDGGFAERMTVRFAPAAPINDPVSSFKVNVRIVHRGAPGIVVGRGNVSVRAPGLTPFRGWSAIEVLHFPIRSFEHFRRKFIDHYTTVGGLRGDHARAYEAARTGRLDDLYERICVDEERLRRGLADGSLAVDTRLRNALRELAEGRPLAFPPRRTGDAAGYAVDGAALEAGELVRLQRRVDEVERRLTAAEGRRRTWSRTT